MDETDHKHSHTYLQLGGYDHPPPLIPTTKINDGWGVGGRKPQNLDGSSLRLFKNVSNNNNKMPLKVFIFCLHFKC